MNILSESNQMTDKLTFNFAPRWKEELVCLCALGSFVLEMPIGVTSVYLPTEDVKRERYSLR
jgi:hypothetical protein